MSNGKSILDSIRKKASKAKKNEAFGPMKEDYWYPKAAEKEKTEEELLREEFPSLQDAWEKYQIVLKMVKASKPKKDTAEDILDRIRKKKANGPITTATQQRLKEIARKFSK